MSASSQFSQTMLAATLLLGFGTASAKAGLVCAEMIADAGEVRSGIPLVHSFSFVNQGPTPVEITGARASCGCMKPRLEQKTLQPGERGALVLEVNTLSQASGPHQWQTTLTYKAAAATDEIVLLLRARIVTEVTVQPASMTFFADSAVEHELILTDLRTKPLSITDVKTTSPRLKSQVVGQSLDPAGHAVRKLRLQIDGDFSQGRHDEVVAIYTDDPVYRELKVPVTVVKQGRQRLTVTPDSVHLEAQCGQPVPSRIVLIRDSQNQPVIIESVTADHPAVTCRWAQGPGTNATLKIQLDHRQLAEDNLESAVHIEVREPVRQSLSIPLTCTLK